MRRYNPKEIEPKWQKIWDENQVYKADLSGSKPKYMAMSMFNYPSGAGIHIGHAMNYTISDVKSRFKRQSGYESYHPVGWDAFGLPAENYAIKAGVSPQASMAKIIPDYHKQYKAMGWSNDWSKEIATHQPEYYKWTQWIFSQMYKNGLAYQDVRMQWWCEICQTVLANEQIVDGKCWRHDGPDDPIVAQKEVKQWFFKITDYAEELLEATDNLDWTESVKLAQKNWIGKSKGAEVKFQIPNLKSQIEAFTTRPDTIFGATFLVLAPEHELVGELTVPGQKNDVEKYLNESRKKTELERQSNTEKTGVFTGSYAINPANDEKIQIWIADYVLTGYGTGAIMAVPAHDKRDYEFAQKYDLEILRVVKNSTPDDECSHEEGLMINSGEYDGMVSSEAREKIIADLTQKDVAVEKTNYKMRDWSVSRQRYWGAPIPIIYCKDCGPQLVPDDQLPVILPELDDFQPSGDGKSALARATDWLKVGCLNCDNQGERETDTLDTYICSSWYMFRYLDPQNNEQPFDKLRASKWMPIDFYNGGDHATAHLLYARFVARFFNKIGLTDNPEPFKQMLFNGKVTAADGSAFSKSKGNGVDPLEIIESGYGADALRTYLMFAAPLEFGARWDPKGVPGAFRYISRLWNMVQEYTNLEPIELSQGVEKDVRLATHSMIKKATTDLEANHYNTAISALMKCVNDLYKLKTVEFGKCEAWEEALASLIACSAPFTPHASEEMWQNLGKEGYVSVNSWPTHDEKYLRGDSVNVVVQINGKFRGNIQVASGASEAEVTEAAKADTKVASHLGDKQIIKTIYVPNKIINFVV